jgi:hypothetical protein
VFLKVAWLISDRSEAIAFWYSDKSLQSSPIAIFLNEPSNPAKVYCNHLPFNQSNEEMYTCKCKSFTPYSFTSNNLGLKFEISFMIDILFSGKCLSNSSPHVPYLVGVRCSKGNLKMCVVDQEVITDQGPCSLWQENGVYQCLTYRSKYHEIFFFFKFQS